MTTSVAELGAAFGDLDLPSMTAEVPCPARRPFISG
jgi:hypothetical protein